MKDRQLEVEIISARPKDKGAPSPFARQVIQHIKTDATFSQVVRTTSSELNRRQWLMRQLTIPRKAIVAFAAVLLVSGVGVGAYALQQSKKAQDALDKVGQNQNIQQKAKPKLAPAPVPVPPAQPPQPASPYVDITEWGVRVTFGDDADKVTYKRSPHNPGNSDFYIFSLKDSVASVCQDLGIGIGRTLNQESMNGVNASRPTTKINNYYYYITGAPGGCEDAAINQLRNRIISTKHTISAIQ